MKKYRSVILGCGHRAYEHATAYEHVNCGELVACCDIDKERLEKFRDHFGISGYDNLEEMIRKEKPDLIHLVTPPDSRVELMNIVSSEGIPACIVEKPIACEVKDWKKICKIERNSKTKFVVNHQMRFHPYLMKCREALKSGELGNLMFLDFSAGMNISGQGTHIIDWAMSLNEDNPVIKVFGAANGMSFGDAPHPAPDNTVAQVVFSNGVYGMWCNGSTARRLKDDNLIHTHCRIAAYAEKGYTIFEEFGKCVIATPKGIESTNIAEDWVELNKISQARLTNSVFNWLENDKNPSETNLKFALMQWNIILGLYASALWRKPVDIPFEPPENLFEELGEVLK